MENQIHYRTPAAGKFSTQLAIGTFAFGTVLLLLHLLLPKEVLILIIGLYFVLLATLANFSVLMHLLYHFFINPAFRELLAIKILLVLSNIPIAALYYLIVLQTS